MKKIFEFTVSKDGKNSPFRFIAADKKAAHAHAMVCKNSDEFVADHGRVCVSDNPEEKIPFIAVRFFRWTSALK